MGCRSGGVAVAVAVSLLAAPSAGAQDRATTALNINPSGQYQSPGPDAARQAQMYNALTPLRDAVTDLDLPNYFKPESLEPANVVRTETIPERPGVEIRRDEFNVPYIYGQTDDDVIFGEGYATAEGQNLLLNQGRYNGLLAAIDAPNISAIDLIANLYQFEPSRQTNRIVAEQTKVIQKAGAKGRQLLRDIDTWLAGVNAWFQANSPSTPPFTRNDVYAFNAVKAQFLGEGGGREASHAELLNGLQKRFGRGNGFDVFEDLRGRDDPDSTTTLRKAAPWNPLPSSHKGTVGLRNGTYQRTGPKIDTGSFRIPTNQASNVLVASGQRSATGHPQFVGGIQIQYFFPGLVQEMSLHGPDIDVRGVSAPPFPGYMLIGRTPNFVWTLTSADGDIIDSYAETLCGGSRVKYEYKGKCRKMDHIDAGTLVKGDTRTRITFDRTVHGTVIGYARSDDGKLVAISRRRSSYGRDTLDQLLFQDLTYGRVHSFADFARAASQTPQTFNAFYADASTAGVYTTGALPIRPNGADSDLPTDGRGKYEWTGYLASSKHPQGTVPNGLLVNWNNKPAPRFAASDTRFGDETMLPRVDLLQAELARQGQQQTLGSVTAAMNAAATEDVRGRLLWPILKAVLDRGRPPSALAAGAEAQLDAWAQNRAPRLDLDGDGNLDDPGVAIMDAGWDRIANAAMCPTLGARLCNQLATQQPRFSSPNDHQNQFSGWYHYLAKDLSTLLGRPVKQEYSRGYCGGGNLRRCSAALWRALDQTATQLAVQQGPDPAAWRESAAAQTIHFRPLELIPMAYTNRPTATQQVVSFGG